jgi:hypothetical protein
MMNASRQHSLSASGFDVHRPYLCLKRTILEAFERWKSALIDQDKQTTRAARHRAHARVTSMEDLIAETSADIEGIGIKLALYVYMSGVILRRQTARSNKSCQPTRIAFVSSAATSWRRSRA